MSLLRYVGVDGSIQELSSRPNAWQVSFRINANSPAGSIILSETMFEAARPVPLIDQTSAEESIAHLLHFREILRIAKKVPHPSPFGWYPHDTLGAWWIFHSILQDHFVPLQQVLRVRPVLDVGCGDGDLTFFLSWLGCEVTAVDHASTNFNSMQGVRALKEHFQSRVDILDVDLDSDRPLALPGDDYGLVLLLGILYHLKNPFFVLEHLAAHGRYCMLSTRIAAVTPAGNPMQGEALAYLLEDDEANNDSTNYWIFSETGLLRVLKRTGWEVLASAKYGCKHHSNPSSNDADERMFVFLRSTKHPFR